MANEQQQRARAAFAAAQEAAEAAMEASARVRQEEARCEAARTRTEGLKATVRSWGWLQPRVQAAKKAVAAGEEGRRRLLDEAAGSLPGLLEEKKEAENKEAATEGEDLECGESEGEDDEIGFAAGDGRALRVCAVLATRANELQAQATVASNQLAKAVAANGGDAPAASTAGGARSLAQGGVCDSCGQPVTAEHLCERVAALEQAVAEAEAQAAAAEEAARRAQVAVDGDRLAAVQSQLTALSAEERDARAALEEAEAHRLRMEEERKECTARAKRVEEEGSAQLDELEARVAELAAAEREAADRAAALLERAAEQQRRQAVLALQMTHGQEALERLEAETNPHQRRLDDDEAQLAALRERREALEVGMEEAASSAALHAELQDHFGKRGAQNMLYTLALEQLEACASVYCAELSSGRLQLHLSFDDGLRSVRKRVHVRRGDGSYVERSISQLSGGEWRRVGLSLSLAFADFARQRVGLSCNLLVLDEVMQHMDIDGQAAMARVLKGLGAETTIVIAHGLASDALYGDFDTVDVVEKRGEESRVRVGRRHEQDAGESE